jgi:hypothetical protein
MFVRHQSPYGGGEKKQALPREVRVLYKLALFANSVLVFANQRLAFWRAAM